MGQDDLEVVLVFADQHGDAFLWITDSLVFYPSQVVDGTQPAGAVVIGLSLAVQAFGLGNVVDESLSECFHKAWCWWPPARGQGKTCKNPPPVLNGRGFFMR